MKNCPQTDTMNVYEHGLSVWEHSKTLISGQFDFYKLPDWFIENHRLIVNNLHTVETIKEYNIFHDCGKPSCLVYDEEGRKHFPDHSAVSRKTWLEYSDNQIVADLIGWDMFLHEKTADLILFENWGYKNNYDPTGYSSSGDTFQCCHVWWYR